jgi:hypothetical protein
MIYIHKQISVVLQGSFGCMVQAADTLIIGFPKSQRWPF